MSENNIEVFTAEFRHDVVEKFVKDLINGFIRLPWPTNLESDFGKYTAEKYHIMKQNIEKYASGKLNHEELDTTEGLLFSEIVALESQE